MLQKIWDSITGNPTALLEAVRQIALALILFGIIHWTDQQMAGAMMALSAVLAMFNRSAVTPNARVVTREDPDTGAHVPGPASLPKIPIILLAIALGASMGASACGNRYKAGTPVQAQFAYELDQALGVIDDTHAKIIGAVDSGATTKALADPFLTPAAAAARLAKERVIPLLRAYDAAIIAGDLARRDALHADLKPLLQEFNGLVQQAFHVNLSVKGLDSLANLLSTIQSSISSIRTEWADVFPPAPAPAR